MSSSSSNRPTVVSHVLACPCCGCAVGVMEAGSLKIYTIAELQASMQTAIRLALISGKGVLRTPIECDPCGGVIHGC